LSFELEHRYGPNVHLRTDCYLHTTLARLCHPDTKQPLFNELVGALYTSLVRIVMNQEFPREQVKWPTRMTAMHPDVFLESEVLVAQQKTVSVNLARAGTYPSHICYDTFNYSLNPDFVRQDHILAARMTNEKEQVVGTSFGSSKIGGDVDGAIVVFPDPMGATGGTISEAVKYYKSQIKGTALKYIAINLIITPEYLARLTKDHPDLAIYAIRLDRGLSASDVLKTVPGTKWKEERGLNDKQYIVPGGGGFGELLNNSYV
jgi:uracil phosphoribosyltransferase